MVIHISSKTPRHGVTPSGLRATASQSISHTKRCKAAVLAMRQLFTRRVTYG